MPANTPREPADRRPAAALEPRHRWVLALCILLGVALRGVEAGGKSLWLDEYHTLYIADSGSASEVIEKVRKDFHPPLFFWALSFARWLDPHLQRWFPLLLSVLTLFPLLSIARHAGLGPLARVSACGLFLFVPYQVQFGVELRAYSALQLCAVVAVWAAVTASGPTWVRVAAFGAATAVGLYLHYAMAVAVVAAGAARCVVRPPGAAPLPSVIAAGTLGVALFVPWVVNVEGWVFSDPEQILPPGERGDAVVEVEATAPATWPRDLGESAAVPARMLVPMMRALGPPVDGAIRAAASLLFAALALGTFALGARLVQRRRVATSAAWTALLAGSFGYLLTAAACVAVWKRVPLQYFLVAAWAWPLFGALAVQALGGRQGTALAAVLLVSSLAAGSCHVLGASREDTEAGVRAAVEAASDRAPLYTAVLWQPPWYPHALPFRYHRAARSLDVREPTEVPAGDSPAGRRPVLVVTRKTAPDGARAHPGLWDSIRRGRRLAQILRIDDATRVLRYEPR